MMELAYHACTAADEFRQCVELQKAVWGFADIDVLPSRLFVVGSTVGGQVFGAFEPPGRLVGFVFALPGLRLGRPYLHSHMLAVLPGYRNRGVGRRLKLMQRDDALARGVRLVEWTFDPLELKNAFFNIERLGVVVRRYVPNAYGLTSSALQGGLPTDRLVAEWWLESERVGAALAGGARETGAPARRVEVPAGIAAIKQRDPALARETQQRVAREFQQAFDDGLAVTGFDRAGAYLCTPWQPPET